MRLFLDTSVLLAASGSDRGASRDIFRRAAECDWILLASPYVAEEVQPAPLLAAPVDHSHWQQPLFAADGSQSNCGEQCPSKMDRVKVRRKQWHVNRTTVRTCSNLRLPPNVRRRSPASSAARGRR